MNWKKDILILKCARKCSHFEIENEMYCFYEDIMSTKGLW